jgi:hypothetical protein
MATATYDLIASQTLGSAASSITFSSIAASWTDLRLVLTAISTGTSVYDLFLTYNADSAANYSLTRLIGNGSSATSYSTGALSYIAISTNIGFGPTPSFYTTDIFSYAGSTYKTALITQSSDYNGSGGVSRIVGLWRSTSAITTINVAASGTTLAAGTTAQLYGIKAA